jgi:Pentapeptide repeats (8 copies)
MARRPGRTAGSFSRAPVWRRRLLLAVVGAAGVAFLLWLVMFAPRLLVPYASRDSLNDVADPAKRHELQDNRLKLQNDARTTLLQGLGGLAVLVGVFFSYRQLQHNIQMSREQHQLDQQGQITERFTRAIDQLGHERLDVRLGGIYALERITNDSPKDQATVAEVLSAFVRGHASWPPARKEQPLADAPLDATRPLREWAPDVQAALTVLGRCDRPRGGPRRLDLTSTDLRRALLGDANLQHTDLTGVRLQGADLYRAQLQGAKLVGAHLQGAYLVDAQLQHANLKDARLRKANLSNAKLQSADLQSADLEDADLNDADLQGAQLQRADLFGVNLQGVNLEGVNLQGARAVRHPGPRPPRPAPEMIAERIEYARLIELSIAEASEAVRWPKGWTDDRARAAGVKLVDSLLDRYASEEADAFLPNEPLPPGE